MIVKTKFPRSPSSSGSQPAWAWDQDLNFKLLGGQVGGRAAGWGVEWHGRASWVWAPGQGQHHSHTHTLPAPAAKGVALTRGGFRRSGARKTSWKS